MSKDPLIFLGHILQCIEQIEEYTQNIDEATFFASGLVQDAVERRLEIVGEAAKNVPQDFKDVHPEIPWAQMAAMRNLLIHEYFGVNPKVVWQVVTQDITPLKTAVEKLLNSN